MRPNSRKIDLWSCLGTPSWRQDGPRATPRPEFKRKLSILGWPVGSKMEPKSIKNLMKNQFDFCNVFESTFRFWFQKPLQNEGSQGYFFNLVANMREVWFWTTLPSFCYIFRLSEGRFSTLKVVFFRCFFECDFKTYFFRFLLGCLLTLKARWEPKLMKKLMKIYADFLIKKIDGF